MRALAAQCRDAETAAGNRGVFGRLNVETASPDRPAEREDRREVAQLGLPRGWADIKAAQIVDDRPRYG
jgi:hypothetical protein